MAQVIITDAGVDRSVTAKDVRESLAVLVGSIAQIQHTAKSERGKKPAGRLADVATLADQARRDVRDLARTIGIEY